MENITILIIAKKMSPVSVIYRYTQTCIYKYGFFNPLYLISRFMNTITMQICFFSSPGFGLLTQFSITTYESSFKRLASVLSNVCARCYQRSHSNEIFSLLSAMEPSLFSQLFFPFSWKSSMFCMHNTWTWSQVVPTKH